jgi:hypothetical protein
VTAKVRLSPAAAKCLLQTIKEGSRAAITSGCSDVWKEGRGQSPSSVISVLLWILLLARERQGGRVQRAAKRQVEEKLGRRRWNRAFAGHPRGSSAVGRPRLAPDAHPPLVRRRPPPRPRGSPVATRTRWSAPSTVSSAKRAYKASSWRGGGELRCGRSFRRQLETADFFEARIDGSHQHVRCFFGCRAVVWRQPNS